MERPQERRPRLRIVLTFAALYGLLVMASGAAYGQGRAMGRATGGIDRVQAERGLSGRFPSSRLTLEPEQYKGLLSLPDLGVLRVLPYYQFSTSFSDNVFLTSDRYNPRSDWIFDNSPGITLSLTGKQHTFQLDYIADIINHADYRQFNRIEHDLSTRLTVDPTRALTFTGQNQFRIRGVPPRYPEGFPDNTTKKYVDNTTTVQGEYRFGKRSSVELTYDHNLVRFYRTMFTSSNFTVDTLTLDLYYRILPKTRLFGEYLISFVDNANSVVDMNTGQVLGTDNIRHQVTTGAAWDATAKLRGRIQGGYEWVDYADLPLSSGPFYSAELEYDYSRRLRFGLRLLQTITETSPVAANTTDGLNFQSSNASLRVTYKVARNLDWHVEGFVVTDNFAYQDQQQRLNEAGLIQSNRKDVLVGVETGLDWEITRNVMVGISYQHQNNKSTGETGGVNSSDLNSYSENLLTLYLSLVF